MSEKFRVRWMLSLSIVMVVAAVAQAQTTFVVPLTAAEVLPDPGPEGATGVATVIFDGVTITYAIAFSGVTTPTAAHIHTGSAGTTGGVVVSFEATFANGTTAGSVTSDQATVDAILADPAAYYVQVHSNEFPGGALRGQLEGGVMAAGTVHYHPVIANLPGQAGTLFVTDVRIVNIGTSPATVTIDYYREGQGGQSSATDSATVTVGAREQLVVNDVLQTVFGLTGEKGGVIITSDQPITSGARIYNDQVAAGNGTLGQYQPGLVLSHGWAAGRVIFLQNVAASSGAGFRSNIGWFNPSGAPVDVAFDLYDTSGFLVDELTATAGPYEMQQFNVGDLFPAAADYGDHYVAYRTSGGENLFVYGSVVDNVNGDASYVAATP